MSIPKFTDALKPVMLLASDAKEHSLREAIDTMSRLFNLTIEERNRPLPSGTGTYLRDRTSWAITYLKKAKLLESTKRGCFRITERGMELIRSKPETIDLHTLEKYDEYVEFKNFRSQTKTEHIEDIVSTPGPETPRELMELGFAKVKASLIQELLERVKGSTPSFFEELVVDLMLKMGYGGFREDAGEVTGKPGDGGIDGIINEDRLGMNAIHIQAKKWDGPVGRPELQKFVGALHGRGANKGIFVTSSSFTEDARRYADANLRDTKLVIIDGQRLAELMVEYGIGVTKIKSYEIMKLDTDYFEE